LAAGPFPGFGPAAFRFFAELGTNNTKAWFESNRANYDHAVKAPISALVAAVSSELAYRSLPLDGDPKRSSFRIHRDTRFSHDKAPYNTNCPRL
jgi:uncharacterized protein (TIGR02453 family)